MADAGRCWSGWAPKRPTRSRFLALALAYEREHCAVVAGFLHWLAAGEIEVKRDFGERQRDEVRVLTVHGAKGLEAPIVFLPDTMQLPDWPPRLLWSETGGLPLWSPRKVLDAPFYAAERAAFRARQMQEYRRLLYVALTRRRTGCMSAAGKRSGRFLIRLPGMRCVMPAGMASPSRCRSTPGRRSRARGLVWHGLRITGAQTSAPARDRPAATARSTGKLPRWAAVPPAPEPDPPKPLLPSRPSGPEPATLSPLAIAGRDRFKRGLLVHKLLQSLPELALEQRENGGPALPGIAGA